MLSQKDCQTFGGCQWSIDLSQQGGSCSQATTDGTISYCSTIKNPSINCYLTFGCTYLNNQCVPFAGCSAYIGDAEKCESISYQCVYSDLKDGCTQAKMCSEYKKGKDFRYNCPRIDIDGRKCFTENNQCRNYFCSESTTYLSQNIQCDAFSAGCISNGCRCQLPPLQQCSYYKGYGIFSDNCCMTGLYGTCTNNDKVEKQCMLEQNKLCSAIKCEYYSNDTPCITDKGKTITCLDVRCQKYEKTSDVECDTAMKGCKTNGKFCVSQRSSCSEYTGTILTCLGFIGTDGQCKGTSDTPGPCSLKDCSVDSLDSYTTDILCMTNIQSWCITTGKGCVKTLQPCSTYYSIMPDGSDCVNLIGAWGKCQAGTNGKCAPLTCSNAPITYTTNQACSQYFIDCATTGQGCITQTKCINTLQEITCQGTKEGSIPCAWSAKCISNTSCSSFTSQSICQTYQSSAGNSCIWENQKCREALATDLIGSQYSTDDACEKAIPGMVTNGIGCVDPKQCNQFIGDKATCLSFKAHCTNSEIARATDQCIDRQCSDAGLTFTSDLDCDYYLPGCLTNGNGCISNIEPCQTYLGTQQQCDQFRGYFDGQIQGARCWNTSNESGQCTEKLCQHASQMANNSDCDQFLKGCLFDGLSSCNNKSAPCTSYYGDINSCLNVKGSNQSNTCFFDEVTGNKCRNRVCTDNNTLKKNSECDQFLKGCVTNSKGCIDPDFPCDSDQASCNTNPFKCIKISPCKSKICSNKIDAISNQQCIAYHQRCRLQYAGNTCVDAQSQCSQYIFPTNATDKQEYCSTMTTSNNINCAYNFGLADHCVDRTCDQWNGLQTDIPCSDYLGTNSCKISIQNNNYCYGPKNCNSYEIPSNVIDINKNTWCFNIKDNLNENCIFDSLISTTTCKSGSLPTCEEIKSPINIDYCNSLVGDEKCQWYNSKCISFKATCLEYSLTEIDNPAQFCSSVKQSNYLQCKYDSSVSSLNCIPITCADIQSPTSQSDCDVNVTFLRCTFYPQIPACYSIVPCTQYTFPNEVTTQEDKKLFCQNMFHNIRNLSLYGYNQYCSFNFDLQICADPVLYCKYQVPASNLIEFCNARRDSLGRVCTYYTSYSDSFPQYCKVSEDYCQNISSALSIQYFWECDIMSHLGMCEAKDGHCVIKTQCYQKLATGEAFLDKLRYCKTQNCTYQSGDKCETSPWCEGYGGLDPNVDNTEICSEISIGKFQCEYMAGSTSCSKKVNCMTHPSPKSQADCDLFRDGYDVSSSVIGCVYYQRKCYQKRYNCSLYLPIGKDDKEKKIFCNTMLEGKSGQAKVEVEIPCQYILGSSSCVKKGACNSYSVVGLADYNSKVEACKAVTATNTYGCTYWIGNPTTCADVNDCSTYSGGNAETIIADCAAQKDPEGYYCKGNVGDTVCQIGSSKAPFVPTTCENIPNPVQQSNCDKYFSDCQFYLFKCYTKSECSYLTTGQNAKSFCAGLKNSVTNEYCTASNDSDSQCTNRNCSDISSSNHLTCKQYKSTCKSNGSNCIDSNITCENYKGISSYCGWALDTDNLSQCTSDQISLNQVVCANKSCNQNVVATSDLECEAFLSGCLTKSNGCISNTEPCSSYYGTISQCSKFTGKGQKCWGISETFAAACKGRACFDIINAKSDSDCITYLPDCRFNGSNRCISSIQPCSSYLGTIDTCKNIRGVNQTVLCWGTSTSINVCRNRNCSDFAGTDDQDCQAFLPAKDGAPPNCITDGTQCVTYPKHCSDFNGTQDICPKFTAIDGPCYSNSESDTSQECQPKACISAPNTLTTDNECQAFHPSCITTGRGCISMGIGCNTLQTNTSCGAKSGCLWVSECNISPIQCQQLTASGQSICTNTPLLDGTKCAWGDNICRNFTCVDYDANLKTHQQCNKLNNTCTTNGAGCITIGPCDSYIKRVACKQANTTDISAKCTWDYSIAKCRQRQCSDLSGQTNEECNNFLKGCKTNGSTCIDPPYSCEVFNDYPLNCLQDSTGYPCLYVNNICYNYARCEDGNIFQCSSFSKYCIRGTDTCVSITSCDQYLEQGVCQIGTNNTKCAWIYGKCKIFFDCSEVSGQYITQKDCDAYGSSCILATDGDSYKCILKSTCESYKSLKECSQGGSDGQCFWVKSSETCKLRECSDFGNGATDSECAQFSNNDKCQTDGIACISKPNCSQFQTQVACLVDFNGNKCHFDTEKNICRDKTCYEIIGNTQQQCNISIKGQICMYNGSRCFAKSRCVSYNQSQCIFGGTDGPCYFQSTDSTDSLKGYCTLLSVCKQANNYEIYCKAHSGCKWTSTNMNDTIITSCSPKTCEDVASGSHCNPIPSEDGKKFNICILQNSICSPGEPATLLSDDCFIDSARTYTWDQFKQQCVACRFSIQNDQTHVDNIHNIYVGGRGAILSVIITLAIIAQ